jgi:DNA polymerase III epsilon subunit-like protein
MSRTDTDLRITPAEAQQLLKVFPYGVVAIDLETTGLSPLVDRIIEIAAVKITSRGETEVFHQLINPLTDITPANAAIHGLTNEDLKNAPTLKRPMRSLWDFVGRTQILAHNALFDGAFLVKGSHDFLIELPPVRVFDSAKFARALLKNAESEAQGKAPQNFRLSTLAEFFQVPLHHHIALEDTYACLKVMAALIERTPSEKLGEFKERSFTMALSQYKKDAAFIVPPRFDDIRELIRAQTVLDIQYTGGTQEEEWRPVKPIAMIPMPRGPVLYGVCLITKMNKSFVLKRIKAFKVRTEPLPTTPVQETSDAEVAHEVSEQE